MSKARSGSSFVREGRQRLGSSSSGTTSIPIDPNFRAKNRRTVEQWDKDDGNYVNYTNPGSADSEWLEEIGAIFFNPNTRIAKIQSKFSEDQITAIYNYALGAGKFNFPLRGLSKFEGSEGEHDNTWYIPKYLFKDYLGDNYINLSSKEEKHFERELSRTFKYTTDRGIIVARGGSASSGIPKVGELTKLRGYTSTAYNGKDWGVFMQTPVRYIIRIPKGSRILHISGQNRDGIHMDSLKGRENEILLRKNAVFRTIAVKKQPNGQTYIYQDFLGYGSKDKLKNRQLKGTPDHSIYKKIRVD